MLDFPPLSASAGCNSEAFFTNQITNNSAKLSYSQIVALSSAEKTYSSPKRKDQSVMTDSSCDVGMCKLARVEMTASSSFTKYSDQREAACSVSHSIGSQWTIIKPKNTKIPTITDYLKEVSI